MEQSIWNSLLGEACHKELLGVVRLLVKEDPQRIAAHNNLLIRWAAYNGKTELASLLIEAGADVTADDNYAVKYAASDRNYELIFLLVEAGATLTIDSLYSWKQVELDRLLIEAVDNGLTGLVSLSAEAGADPRMWDDRPLEYAIRRGHNDIETILREAGASFNRKGVK